MSTQLIAMMVDHYVSNDGSKSTLKFKNMMQFTFNPNDKILKKQGRRLLLTPQNASHGDQTVEFYVKPIPGTLNIQIRIRDCELIKMKQDGGGISARRSGRGT